MSDKEMIIEHICAWFLKNQQKLGFAESCTGGLVSSWIAAQSGVSAFFQGSVVSYAGGVKVSVLGVKTKTIEAFGEVSTKVALEMARGARQKLNSDWAVSITGIAGPTGGTPDKPVGTVCFAVCGPNFEQSVQMKFKEKERTMLQEESAQYALEFLWQSLPHK
jgi:PncC family amidohydrolase